jgi:plastocyanin
MKNSPGKRQDCDQNPKENQMKTATIRLLATLFVSAVTLGFVPAAVAQEKGKPANVAQVVALDECDPLSFNTVLGPDFCKNVSIGILGYTTTFQDLFAQAAAGTPDPGWDFEPDVLNVKQGTTLSVVDQGGEPHTFTEVAKFGGGFIDGLNAGEATVPECAGGFKNVAVAKTRIIQGSQLQVTDLSKGEHLFECCIHPWMRVKVEVK